MYSSVIAAYLLILLLGSQTVNDSLGKLVMIRERPLKPGEPYVLTCVSDDNDAALLWNDDLRNPTKPATIAPSARAWTNRDCLFAEWNICLVSRSISGSWSIVNSATHPMAPIVDRRWNDFYEYSFARNDDSYTDVSDVSPTGRIVFSVRGLGDLHLKLCEKNLVASNSCFCVIVVAERDKKSRIESCTGHWTASQESSQRPCSEDDACAEHSQSTIDAFEWRTFTLSWNKQTMEVGVYDSERFILQKRFDRWPAVKRLYVRSDDAGHVRFHFYDYLLTHSADTSFQSEMIYPKSKKLCMKIFMYSCAECVIEITVIYNSYAILKHSYSLGDEIAWENLSKWKIVILNIAIPNFHYGHSIVLVFRAISRGYGNDHRWAIGGFQSCNWPGRRISSAVTYYPPWESNSPLLPTVKCQTLSYGPSLVIGSDVAITSDNTIDPPHCVRGEVSPLCQLKCVNSEWCLGTSVCDGSGCICAKGIANGGECNAVCPDGTHGYNCEEKCGSCLSGVCHRVYGYCTSGCVANYLPPYCKTELRAPEVTNITASSVILKYTLPNTEEIKDVEFQLRTTSNQTEKFTTIVNSVAVVEEYTRELTGLHPGTLYHVWATVKKTNGLAAKSRQKKFKTKCGESIAPINLRAATRGNGVVELSWYQPSAKTIAETCVKIEMLDTDLRNDSEVKLPIFEGPAAKDCGLQSKRVIRLRTASTYRFFAEARNKNGCTEQASLRHRIPAGLGLGGEANLEVSRTRTFMELRLPSVTNETRHSVVNVVVKGPTNCTDSPVPNGIRLLANMTDSAEGWIAATFADAASRPEYLKIGKDPDGNKSTECPLQPEETYVVLVVVVDSTDGSSATAASLPIPPVVGPTARQSDSKKFTGFVAILIIVLIILSIFFYTLLVWHRKFTNTLGELHQQTTVAYSQNMTNSFGSVGSRPSYRSQSLPMSEETELNPGIIPPRVTIVTNPYPNSINIKDFEDYVKDAIASGLLKSQFETLRKGLTKQSRCGSIPENQPKNRYENILPYDQTRVILKKQPGDPFSDYINANYVPGIRKKKAYIAAQGPTSRTVADFWRMIWQEGTLVVCMLASIVENGKKKCEQYWPEFGASETYGEITVLTEDHRVFADFMIRNFRVSCKEEIRKIEHLHYTGWPDHMVPVYPHSLITYIKKLQLTTPVEKGPIVVHCSAGVGRTGTIILTDICLRRAVTKGVINVLAELKRLRECRVNMVDNDLQYIFVHLVLTESLISLPTDLPCNDRLPRAVEKLKNELPNHMKRLRDTAWKDQALRFQITSSPVLPFQLAKNRFPELAPDNSGRIYLRRYPPKDDSSDYISAVVVDGLREKKQYLASQLPLPSTLSDFWRLIAEQRIELVVILQQPNLDDPTCCEIITDNESFDPVPFINVESRPSSNPNTFPKINELLLTDKSGETKRTQPVTVLTCLEWGLGTNGEPPPPIKLVELWLASENIHREKGPTLVICHDGLTGCGLYLALSFLLERMAVERECDVIFAVRAIRRSRPEFVRSQEQFNYLYDAAAKYIESFETYANFS